MTAVEHIDVVRAGKLVELSSPASFRVNFVRFVVTLLLVVWNALLLDENILSRKGLGFLGNMCSNLGHVLVLVVLIIFAVF